MNRGDRGPAARTGPRSRVRVLDLSQVGPGPRCTSALADLGATVIKVLPPQGGSRIEPAWWAYGAGRRTKRIRIDLKSHGGRDVFLRLVATSQIVVESYRPGVAARLGIGYDDCKGANPDIVYCAITGYGQDGPYAQWAGHDLNYLAVGGYLATQGRRPDGGPALPGATVADAAAGGWHAAMSICAALAGGEGGYLDVSVTDGVVALMSLFVDEYLATGTETKPGEALLTGRYACYDVYACADGRWISVAAIEGRFFANLCERLGCPELAAHQYDVEKQDEIRAAFRQAFASRDRDELVAELAPHDTCVAPVLRIAEVPDDPHLAARGAFVEGREGVRQVAPVLAGAGEPGAVPDGTDTDALLADAGYAADEIATMRSEGVVA